jgi:hypothetical protein
MHNVFDLWADPWRQRETQGDVIVVRCVDDYVVGYSEQEDILQEIMEFLVGWCSPHAKIE